MKKSDNLEKNENKKLSLDDLIIKESLGKGSFGEVFLVINKNNNKNYALKVIDKNFINKYDKLHYIIIEKNILLFLKCSKIVKLYATFQDKANWYFVLEYICYGTLNKYIKLKGILEWDQIRFLTSEILKILKYLRINGIVHRDLKPENLMLTKNMNLKLIDFGTAKLIENENNKNLIKILENNKFYYDKTKNINSEHKFEDYWKRNSLAGSPFYISPEVINNKEINFGSDYWSLGILVYKMLTGKFPFNQDYFSFIQGKSKLKFKENTDKDCQDFIQKLLIKDPNKRIGMNENDKNYSFTALLNHPFLKNYKIDNEEKEYEEIKSPLIFKKEIKIIKKNINLGLNGNNYKNNSAVKSLNIIKNKKNKLLIEGFITKRILKVFKVIRYCKIYSSGEIIFFNKNKKYYRNEIKINESTKIYKKGNIIKIFNSFLNNTSLILNKNDYQIWWDVIKNLTKKKNNIKRSFNF